MISAGNDIVALKIVDKQRTNLPAFYLKFITVPELALYVQPKMPFNNFVWLLWSVKEAAYKYLKRIDHNLVFSPLKIIIQHIEVSKEFSGYEYDIDQLPEKFYTGTVLYNTYIFSFRSVLNNEFVATIVNNQANFNAVNFGVKQIDGSNYKLQAKAVRLFVLNKLKELLPGQNLMVGKSSVGYPVLFSDDKELSVPLSFSHHHHYVSYSFRISK